VVLPDSHGISRVPRYLGYRAGVIEVLDTRLSLSLVGLSRPFSYPFHIPLYTPRNPARPKPAVWATPRSLAATEGITIVFSSSGYLDVSVPLVYLYTPMDSAYSTMPLRIVGFPIRKSPDQSLLTAPRSISVFAPSFIGTWRQGILRAPFVA
jgi:hypothetical protein